MTNIWEICLYFSTLKGKKEISRYILEYQTFNSPNIGTNINLKNCISRVTERDYFKPINQFINGKLNQELNHLQRVNTLHPVLMVEMLRLTMCHQHSTKYVSKHKKYIKIHLFVI